MTRSTFLALVVGALGGLGVQLAMAQPVNGCPNPNMTCQGIKSTTVTATTVTATTGKFDKVDAGVLNVEGAVGVAGTISSRVANAADGVLFTNEAEIQWPDTKIAEVGTTVTVTGALSASGTMTASNGILIGAGQNVNLANTGSGISIDAIADSNTTPTVVACSGTAASVTWNNGTANFRFDVGTACAGESTAVITLPATTNCWTCSCFDIVNDATLQEAFGGCSTTTFTIANRTRLTTAAADFTDNADIQCACRGG